jgi:hypothetical protein
MSRATAHDAATIGRGLTRPLRADSEPDSTFSCDIAYSRDPAASKVCCCRQSVLYATTFTLTRVRPFSWP